MHVIEARNVNDAYRIGLTFLNQRGKLLPSRNGPVRRVPFPVTTVYSHCWERVLFDSQRDANPFFHLFEALWILNGGNDVDPLTQFVPNFVQFSDDGTTLHGAYGYRWRHWPRGWDWRDHATIDQLAVAIDMLQRNPNDRRVVIGMWDPARDLNKDSKDIPCNDLIKFMVVDGALDMHIYCRSNDMVWGGYGANAVHFSFLLEYMAQMIGIMPGFYYHISGDFHGYVEQPYKWETYYPFSTIKRDPYTADPKLTVIPLVIFTKTFDHELTMAMHDIRTMELHHSDISHFRNPFFRLVVQPMYMMHRIYRVDGPGAAITWFKNQPHAADAEQIDWLRAGVEWLTRRDISRMKRASIDGPSPIGIPPELVK